jgi:hypothetical protein
MIDVLRAVLIPQSESFHLNSEFKCSHWLVSTMPGTRSWRGVRRAVDRNHHHGVVVDVERPTTALSQFRKREHVRQMVGFIDKLARRNPSIASAQDRRALAIDLEKAFKPTFLPSGPAPGELKGKPHWNSFSRRMEESGDDQVSRSTVSRIVSTAPHFDPTATKADAIGNTGWSPQPAG